MQVQEKIRSIQDAISMAQSKLAQRAELQKLDEQKFAESLKTSDIFYKIVTKGDPNLYTRAEMRAKQQQQCFLKKPKGPKQDWYITAAVGNGRERSRCLDPDFIYIGGMWPGRKWKISSMHMIRGDIDIDEPVDERPQSFVSVESMQSASKRSLNSSFDEEMRDSLDDNRLYHIGQGLDKRIKCRNCGEAGHYKERCPKPQNEFVLFCHVCKVFGVGHDSLICPSKALRCQQCNFYGHTSESCHENTSQRTRNEIFWRRYQPQDKTLYKRLVPADEAIKQQVLDLDQILAHSQSDLICFVQQMNSKITFVKKQNTNQLLARAYEELTKLSDLPCSDPADELTVPHYHRYDRIYCPKCMGNHSFDNCSTNLGRGCFDYVMFKSEYA